MIEDKFQDIRPYIDEEEVLALSRISKHPLLAQISAYLFPGKRTEDLRQFIASLKNVDEFQSQVMLFAIKKIISDTAKTLSYSGVEKFKDGKKHLFISNHRDILLDSAIIQVIFRMNDIQTSEMAVGDNLITDSFIEDIARSNKMIKVVRSTNPRELYNTSSLLSEYIRDAITSQRSSVWIAQRNGRTKDGIDITEQGLLKMLDMSGSGDFIKDFEDLSIVPVSISYEYEPCDLLKTKELYISRRRKYIKSPGEDLNSILTGIMQYKGSIHIAFGDPIETKSIENVSSLGKNEKFKKLAELIDSQILGSYNLWKTNYIAFDILNKSQVYQSMYTPKDKEEFLSYFKYKLSESEGDFDEMQEIFLSIYANPVVSKKI